MKKIAFKLTVSVLIAGLSDPVSAADSALQSSAVPVTTQQSTQGIASVVSACNSSTPKLTVNIDTNSVLRKNTPPGIFGYTVDWSWFQKGYVRNQVVNPDVISWLAPFKGATYRYSGGNAFEWRNAVGPIAQRKPVNRYSNIIPVFGPAEFFNFIHKVNGKAVILLDVLHASLNNAQMIADNLAYLKWIDQNVPNGLGPNSVVKYFELGNELDTGSPGWSAATYISRVKGLITAAKRRYPDVKFAVMGKTVPWGPEADSSGQNFDATVAAGLAPIADAVTIHPYYDGYPINMIQGYIDERARQYQRFNPAIKVLVTEHGRWPPVPKPPVSWATTWYVASGSAGGISSADYMLMALSDANIAGSEWHTIATDGPWQLFHLDNTTDQPYPSAVYWAFRAIHEGFLNDVVAVNPALVSGNSYGGGYDLRFLAMKNNTGNASLMGVNRSSFSRLLSLKAAGIPPDTSNMEIVVFQADAASSDDTDNDQSRFKMKTATWHYSPANGLPVICIPPDSAFSIILGARN